MMGNGCRRKGDGAEETGKQVPKFPVSGHVVKNRMTVIFRKKMEGCLIWKIRELTSYLISAPFFVKQEFLLCKRAHSILDI